MLITAAMVSMATAAPVRQPEADEWWRTAVFYEIFVRSFADSTKGSLAGDGIGDLRGIIERLDYLNDGNPATTSDLGVTGIWLMPICESPSYHGYDVVDYERVDPEYGTNADFKALVAACHERGIRIIVDNVINHCGMDHPWFQQALDPSSDKRDWFVWRDEPLTGEGAPQHPVWHDHFKPQAGQFYYGFFWHGMPDLNLRSAGATQAMREQSRFWVTEMGADGLRLDAVKHLIEDGVQFENTLETIAWLQGYEKYMHSVKPGVFLVGEVWDDTDVVAQYVNDGIDSAFEFSTCFAIEKGINSGDASGIGQVLSAAWNDLGGVQSTMTGNHDMDRVMSRLGGSFEKSACAATILLTTPGVPFIYYGEEIGMEGTKPDPDIRTPMQWTGNSENAGFTTATPWKPVDQSVTRANVELEALSGTSLLATYRKLISLRRSEPALAVGDFSLVETGDARVLAYVRASGSNRVLVIVNVSGDAIHEGWALDAGQFGAALGGKMPELIHGAMAYGPQRSDDKDWRPLSALEAYTGYAIRLP